MCLGTIGGIVGWWVTAVPAKIISELHMQRRKDYPGLARKIKSLAG